MLGSPGPTGCPCLVALFEALCRRICGLLDYLKFLAVQSRVRFRAVKLRCGTPYVSRRYEIYP